MEINVIPENFQAPQDNYPFPTPFILSSVEKDWCHHDWARIVFIKRRHLEENIKVIADEMGMGEDERKRFLDYWCQPCDLERTTLLAEKSGAFDLRYRVGRWMETRGIKNNTDNKSRAEKYAESARQFFSNAQAVPPGADGTQGFGYADIPDEQ